MTLDPLYTIPGHSAATSVDVDPRGRYLAVGSIDAVCSLLDVEEFICSRSIGDMEWPIRCAKFNYDGEYLALSSEDLFIGIFMVDSSNNSNSLVHKLPTRAHTNTLSWHRSKNILAYASDEMNRINNKPEGNVRIYGF